MFVKEFKFQNGDKVIEKITGFMGIITGTAFYLTGCNQYCVTAKSKKDNTEPISIWYDEGRLELLKSQKVKINDVKTDEDGCDIKPPFGKKGI